MASEIVHPSTEVTANEAQEVAVSSSAPPQPDEPTVGGESASASSSSSSTLSTPAAAAPAAAAPAAVSPNANPSGPSVLVLGGCGFLGRHFVAHLTKQRLASRIIVADKALVATSHMSAEHKAFYEDKALVTVMQADLAKDAHVERVFKAGPYTYVFNLCGETRFGLSDKDYHIKNVETAAKCSLAAKAHGVTKFVEVSTAGVYKSDKSPSNESASLKPWTIQATKRLEAEQAVRSVEGLASVILRPAIVYGTGDLTGLTPRMSCAAVYKESGEKMRFLWSEDLRINVVHADDVAAAMWVAATECPGGSVYNLADSQDLTQGKLNTWLASMFAIKVSYLGSLISNLARLNLSSVAEEANDKHVPGFTQLCHKHSVGSTPISPYIGVELLRDNHLSVDGRRIEKDTTFRYQRQVSQQLVTEQLRAFIDQGVFPPIL